MDHIYASIFVFLILSVCAIIALSTEIPNWKKISITVGLFLCGILSYRTFNLAFGHPAKMQEMHKNTLILSHYPDEKNELIYIWIKDKDGMPMSYTLKYSKKMHQELEEGRKGSKGKPYKATVHGYTKPLNPLSEALEETRLEILPQLPEKGREKSGW